MAEADQTFPHDYRALFAGGDDQRPTIVGGQAVNLWAITYLDRLAPSAATTKYGSHDLDLISSGQALRFLKSLANWRFTPTPMKHFGTGITATLQSVTPDGRRLLVEVLHSVAGLNSADLQRTSELTADDGTIYRLLDPIAMLKAKAYNVRHFKQNDDPPRHDREHLHVIAKCFPEYLRQVHETAVRRRSSRAAAAREATREAAAAVSAAYATLTDESTAAILRAQGLPPEHLIPPEFEQSPIEKVANAWSHQHPRLLRAGFNR